ncbi:type IV secretion system protein [Candidatus Saccharibacteria bacterium]|nr:type IV secretion system protein [Candidatus Saccharibacteria bacterium]
MKRKLLFVVILGASLLVATLFGKNVLAADRDTIIKKWQFTQYVQCAKDGGFNAYFVSQSDNPANRNDLIRETIYNKKLGLLVPSYNYASNMTANYDCKEVLGDALASSPFGADVTWSDGNEAKSLLTSLGYSFESDGSSEIFIKPGLKGGDSVMTDFYYMPPPITYKFLNDSYWYTVPDSKGMFIMEHDKKKGELKISLRQQLGNMCVYIGGDIKEKTWTIPLNRPSAVVSEIRSALGNLTFKYLCPNTNWNQDAEEVEIGFTGTDFVGISNSGRYTFDKDSNVGVNTALKNLSGMTTIYSLDYSNSELYTLYTYYLSHAVSETGGQLTCESISSTSNLKRVKLKDDTGTFNSNCYVGFNGKEPADIKVNTQLPSSRRASEPPRLVEISLERVINWLNGVDSSTLTDVPSVSDIGSNGEVLDDPTSEMNCANSGGAESLGWIVCPIMKFLSDGANKAYNDVVEPSLRVDPKLFSGNDGGVYQGWETFRNIANVLFIILLLVVIFSQLTGVGIDNYGIKKILPKLIIAAILINLSYLICLVFVDLSNILGNSLRSLFDGLGANLSPALDIPDSNAVGEVKATAITGVVILGTLAAMVGAVWQNPAIILSLLVAALGVAISVFFLFILLSVREAAIVVLVAISPLAVVCYTLPNTKKFFDKWLKFFEGLLLVYPICGLLVGGGNYVSNLLLSADFAGGGFLNAFTAMIVGIVPIFFIPTVLKGSFAAMGAIGGKLAGLGRNARSLATNKIRGSEGYKMTQARGLERRNRIKAGIDSKGQPTWRGAIKSRFARTGVGRAMGYQKLQASRVAAANKTREQDIQQAAELGDVGLRYDVSKNPTQSTEDMLIGRLDAAAASGDTNEIFSIIEQMKKSNMKDSRIAQATRRAIGNNLNIRDDGRRKNFLEEFGKKYGGDFLRKDFEQAHWARQGGVGVNGISALGIGGQWANQRNAAGKSNMSIDDMKDEDVAALSSDRLYDMIAGGMISQAQAQRVWSANGNMDDTNRLMLGAYSNEGTILTKGQAAEQLDPNTRTMDERTVRAYTERAATDTRIRDVEWRDSQGRHQQTDPLIVRPEGHIVGNQSNMHNGYLEQQGTSAAELEEINRNLRR